MKTPTKVVCTVVLKLKENPTMPCHSNLWDMDFNGDAANIASLLAYIQDAVSSWGGQERPDSVVFPSNIESVQVKLQRKPRRIS